MNLSTAVRSMAQSCSQTYLKDREMVKNFPGDRHGLEDKYLQLPHLLDWGRWSPQCSRNLHCKVLREQPVLMMHSNILDEKWGEHSQDSGLHESSCHNLVPSAWCSTGATISLWRSEVPAKGLFSNYKSYPQSPSICFIGQWPHSWWDQQGTRVAHVVTTAGKVWRSTYPKTFPSDTYQRCKFLSGT